MGVKEVADIFGKSGKNNPPPPNISILSIYLYIYIYIYDSILYM